MRKVRRKCIIREYDYNKLVKEAIPEYYTRSEFVPITLQELERDYTFNILKEPEQKRLQNYRSRTFKPTRYPVNVIYEFKSSPFDILSHKIIY